MKIGKEVKLDINNKNFKSKLGCIDGYENPYSVYLELSSWIKKTGETPQKVFSVLENKIKKEIINNDLYIEYFKDLILILDISDNRFNQNIKTFFSLELNLTQKKNLPLVSKNKLSVKNITESLLNTIIESINSDYLSFSLKKKD